MAHRAQTRSSVLAILLAALVGQAIAGHAAYNNDEIEHAQLLNDQHETLSLGR